MIEMVGPIDDPELFKLFIKESDAFLYKVSGQKYHSENALDLADNVWDVKGRVGDSMPVGYLRRLDNIREVVFETLATPEERARNARRAKRRKKIDWIEQLIKVWAGDTQTAAWQAAGARERRNNSKAPKIVADWKKSALPIRDRAASLAKKYNVSPQYVNREVKKAKLK